MLCSLLVGMMWTKWFNYCLGIFPKFSYEEKNGFLYVLLIRYQMSYAFVIGNNKLRGKEVEWSLILTFMYIYIFYVIIRSYKIFVLKIFVKFLFVFSKNCPFNIKILDLPLIISNHNFFALSFICIYGIFQHLAYIWSPYYVFHFPSLIGVSKRFWILPMATFVFIMCSFKVFKSNCFALLIAYCLQKSSFF